MPNSEDLHYREGKMPKGLTMCDETFGHDMTLYLDTSTGTTRHLVPAEWRRVVFSLMHNLTHMGPRAMVRHVAKRYIWPEMSKQLTRWAQECHECQQSKTQRPIEPGVQDFEVPKKHFTVVHTDVVGPLPMSNGFKYVLTAINRTTRYLVAQSMEDASAKSCAKAFINSTLACQQRSSWIKGERSLANTGKSFRRPWAPSPAMHWSITNKPTAWWNGNTKT